MYKPQSPFNVPMMILEPSTEPVNGVKKKLYPDWHKLSDEHIFFGSFRTFGGTETVSNGVYTLENTAVIETWFRPDIQADCRVVLLQNGVTFDIIGAPENINMRNQYMKFKVKAVGGKA